MEETPISPETQKAQAELEAIRNDPKLRELHKPRLRIGYSKKSNLPYYKPRYALEFRSNLEMMLKDGKPFGYAYKDHKDKSKNTLYLRVIQGKMYLLDHLDPDGFYAIVMDRVAITRERNRGVIMTLVADAALVATPMLNPKDLSEWKHRLESWLENANDNTEFVQDNIYLTDEEIEQLQASLALLIGIGCNITNKSIKIRKFPDELK